MMLTKEEKIRFSRQLLGNEFTEKKQGLLKQATVLVAGIGGLGGAAAQYLAAAGVGKIILAHYGSLELPDLNRQVLMSTKYIGHKRVNVAQRRLLEINPDIDIIPVNEWITLENVHEWVSEADMVLDCRHNFEEKAALNMACIKLKKTLIEGAMDDMFGYLTTIASHKSPCLHCIFPEFPEWDYLGFAVMGVIPGILGPLMALEAIKVLTGTGEPLFSKLLTFDGRTSEFRKLNIKKEPNCHVCANGE